MCNLPEPRGPGQLLRLDVVVHRKAGDDMLRANSDNMDKEFVGDCIKSYVVSYNHYSVTQGIDIYNNQNENILWHASIRPSESLIVFNQKKNGKWSDERVFIFSSDYIDKIEIAIFLTRVECYINDMLVDIHEVDPLLSDLSISTPLDWQEQIFDKNKSRAIACETIRFCNQKVIMPHCVRGSNEQKCALEYLKEVENYLRYSVYSASEVIFDLTETCGIVAIALGALHDRSQIICVVKPQDLSSVQACIDCNNIQNIKIILVNHLATIDACSDLLNNIRSVSMFGDSIFSSQGSQFIELYYYLINNKLLSAAFLVEENIIPANQLFPNQESAFELNVIVKNTKYHLRWDRMAAMRHQPGLDIMIAAYNTEKYIEQCISSVLCDGRDDIRVFLVNDGSSDRTLQLVTDRFGNNDQVNVVNKLNGGCASARNYGRPLSNASHIAFVDADDFVDQSLFAHLFDLSIYTGREIVQSGFDFFDVDAKQQYKPSYEDDVFKDLPRQKFGDHFVVDIPAHFLLSGQPTIWRRVYRRDFLDSKNLYFPEHIRAFDDWIFHICSLRLARDVLMIDNLRYHYRQHATQDIKQKDERHFYVIETANMFLRLAVTEGWNDFHEIIPSILNSFNWSLDGLREDLIPAFVTGIAKFWVLATMIFGEDVFLHSTVHSINNTDLPHLVARETEIAKLFGSSYAWTFINNLQSQPELVKMMNSIDYK